MKIIFPHIDHIFCIDDNKINTVIIESPEVLLNIINDIYIQTQGFDGETVLSIDDKPVPINKHIELLTNFIPFDINRKTLLNKLNSSIEKELVSSSYYAKTMEMLSSLECLLMEATQSYKCNIDFSKLDIGSLVKSANVSLVDDYVSLAEKLADFFDLVYEYEGKKLFIAVNVRSYISEKDFEAFCETCLDHEFSVLFIDNREYELNKFENRYIIDSNLCEIK